MNKVELSAKVAEEIGTTKKAASEYVDAVLNVVATTLRSGEDVKLANFGTFCVVERDERMGRNPQTGESIKIAACKAPKFKASKALKDAVNE